VFIECINGGFRWIAAKLPHHYRWYRHGLTPLHLVYRGERFRKVGIVQPSPL